MSLESDSLISIILEYILHLPYDWQVNKQFTEFVHLAIVMMQYEVCHIENNPYKLILFWWILKIDCPMQASKIHGSAGALLPEMFWGCRKNVTGKKKKYIPAKLNPDFKRLYSLKSWIDCCKHIRSCHGWIGKTSGFHTAGPLFKSQPGAPLGKALYPLCLAIWRIF